MVACASLGEELACKVWIATREKERTNDFLVELVGIEPTTSSLRTMRSPS